MLPQVQVEHYAQRLRDAQNFHQFLQRELEHEEQEVKRLEQEVFAHEQALVLINGVTEAKRKELANRVENLISYALSQIFERNYRFVLHMEQRGQQVDFQFKIKDPDLGDHAVDLYEARGGGLVQVVAFLLRLLVILSSRPPLRRIMFLDEPLAMISEEYVDNLCNFIRLIAQKTGFQFVCITHSRNLLGMADRAYQFKLVNGETQVLPLELEVGQP